METDHSPYQIAAQATLVAAQTASSAAEKAATIAKEAAVAAAIVGVDIVNIKESLRETKLDIRDIKKTMADLGDAVIKQYVTTSEFSEHLKADEDHETRIRVLERSMWKVIGMAAAIGTIASIATVFLSHYWK